MSKWGDFAESEPNGPGSAAEEHEASGGALGGEPVPTADDTDDRGAEENDETEGADMTYGFRPEPIPQRPSAGQQGPGEGPQVEPER